MTVEWVGEKKDKISLIITMKKKTTTDLSKGNEMNTHIVTHKEQEELKKASMNDLIRAMLGTLLGSK